MARILKEGESVKDYEVVRLLNRGAMAISYEARHPRAGRVFFKQYKSPSPTVAWYEAYKRQQTEIKKRIAKPEVSGFCCGLVEFFETTAGGRCYFQAFEFVESGGSLQTVIDRIRDGRDPFPFEKRLILARRLLAGIQSLHAAGVVHCDLKPQNVQLVKDESISAGFVLKLIDMDFSALAGKEAAWEGYAPYVGSPNYFSPEHLRGERPGPASDIFTCGLMLYELLGQGHPYASDEDARYAKSVLAFAAPPVVLAGPVPRPLNAETAAKMIRRCLSPDPRSRPSAEEILATLRIAPVRRVEPKSVPRTPASEPRAISPDPRNGRPTAALTLAGAGGQGLKMSVRTKVGHEMLRRFGRDSVFHAPHQFTVEPDASGRWFVVPIPGTKNETLLNGKSVRERMPLKAGDVLSVGREATGASKLPLIVG